MPALRCRHGPKLAQSALEGGESVVDVERCERKRLSKVTKFSYLSGGKSLCSIESSARPNKECINASSDIDLEILIRLLKSFPLIARQQPRTFL
jgi:hypothetical protein